MIFIGNTSHLTFQTPVNVREGLCGFCTIPFAPVIAEEVSYHERPEAGLDAEKQGFDFSAGGCPKRLYPGSIARGLNRSAAHIIRSLPDLLPGFGCCLDMGILDEEDRSKDDDDNHKDDLKFVLPEKFEGHLKPSMIFVTCSGVSTLSLTRISARLWTMYLNTRAMSTPSRIARGTCVIA